MIKDIIYEWGIIALFFMMLCNGSMSTPPSELVISTAGAITIEHNEYIIILFVTIVVANYIGTLLLYVISWHKGKIWYDKIREIKIIKKVKNIDKMFPTSEELIDFWRNREWLVFACRFMPFIRSIISIPAGIARMNFVKFSIYSISGMSIWTCGWMLVGRFMMENYLTGKYLSFIAFFLLFIIVYFIGKLIRQKISQ